MKVTDITPQAKKCTEPLRLAAYCRVSSDSADQLHSFAAQIKHYKGYEKMHPEYKLVDIYADEGLSGTCLEKRDDQKRLIQDCKRGKIDRIITKSVSRFARNTAELLAMLRELKEIGVSVYFEEQGIDTNKLNMEMIVTFPGMAAQQESESISGNMRWSYKKRMESGDFNCCTPAYGYDLVNGQLIINEDEAAVVRRIYDLYLQGMGMQAIAELLSKENVPRKYSFQKWSSHTIKYILNNERNIGDALLQKEYTTETIPFKHKINHGELPQYYVENANPAIITKEIYAKAQELQKQKISNDKLRKKQFPLSKVLRCPDCGQTFRRVAVRGSVYWICSSQASRKSECTHRRVKEKSVYEAFQIMMNKLAVFSEPLLETLIQNIVIMQNQTSANHKRIAEIDCQIANLAAQNHVISRLHTNGILSDADHASQSSEINAKISSLRSERKKKIKEDEGDEQLDQLRELYDEVKEYKPSDGFDEELFGRVVNYVTVENNAELTFHLIGGIELLQMITEKGRCKSA